MDETSKARLVQTWGILNWLRLVHSVLQCIWLELDLYWSCICVGFAQLKMQRHDTELNVRSGLKDGLRATDNVIIARLRDDRNNQSGCRRMGTYTMTR